MSSGARVCLEEKKVKLTEAKEVRRVLGQCLRSVHGESWVLSRSPTECVWISNHNYAKYVTSTAYSNSVCRKTQQENPNYNSRGMRKKAAVFRKERKHVLALRL